MKVQLIFGAWFDAWIGFYYDRKKAILYIGIVPCLVHVAVSLKDAEVVPG